MTEKAHEKAHEKYTQALAIDVEKLMAVLCRIDQIIGDAQLVLDKCQPWEVGKIGIVWEAKDIRFGKALTPRIVRYEERMGSKWKYKKLTIRYLVSKAKSKGDFMWDRDLVQRTLEEVVKVFQARYRLMKMIGNFRRACTGMHQGNEAPLSAIENRIHEISFEKDTRRLSMSGA